MRLFALFAAALVGCSSNTGPASPEDGGADTEPTDTPPSTAGEDKTVSVFTKEEVSFTGAANLRVVDKAGTFPDKGTYQSIILHLALECPAGKCDAWDRFGTLGVVTKKGDKPENDTVVEVARFITPYGVGASWDLDVTDLRPLLRGSLTLRVFIDTWVGPGSPYGNGWSVSASFEMKGGVPEKEPLAVVPIWTMRAGVYGDPAKPLTGSFPDQTVALPTGAKQFAVRTFVTGHGQGNLYNCAEFCPREHTITVAGTAHKQKMWRTDCATTAAPGQKGNYKPSRAGWCPGADVKPWTFDATADFAAGSAVQYGVEAYENTCREGAPTCAGCTLGSDCKYDGGNHTEPSYYVSSLLIAYR